MKITHAEPPEISNTNVEKLFSKIQNRFLIEETDPKIIIPFLYRKQTPEEAIYLREKRDIAKILIIYVGGEIGLKKVKKNTFVWKKGFLASYLAKLSQFMIQEPEFLKEQAEKNIFTTQKSTEGKVGRYAIIEYEPNIDASNIGCEVWNQIAKDIQQYYHQYDSFLILHDTETLSFSASALSFMLSGLNKTIIFTGSHIPISDTRNDALDNLLGALTLCMHYDIPEVCVYFNNQLMRGNRSVKIDENELNAFDSPNYPIFGVVGVDIHIRKRYIENFGEKITSRFNQKSIESSKSPSDSNLPASTSESSSHINSPTIILTASPKTPNADSDAEIQQSSDEQSSTIDVQFIESPFPVVSVVRLFPGISEDHIKDLLKPTVQGAVLVCYSGGHLNEKILKAINDATQQGVIIVSVSQAVKGFMSPKAAAELFKVGVVCGHDVTVEAAVSKLVWLLSQQKTLSKDEIKNFLGASLRGELTQHDMKKIDHSFLLYDKLFVEFATKLCCTYNLTSYNPNQSKKNFTNGLLSLVFGTFAAMGDLKPLEKIISQNEENKIEIINSKNYDDRTALHLAATFGNFDTVKFLVENGAQLDCEDKFGRTPLESALAGGKTKTAKYLMKKMKQRNIPVSKPLTKKVMKPELRDFLKTILEKQENPGGKLIKNVAKGMALAAFSGILTFGTIKLYCAIRNRIQVPK